MGSPIRMISSAYLNLLIFLAAILIPACFSSSLVFPMRYSAYKLNKQSDNMQPCPAPFPILNQSVASWCPQRFLRRQVRWSGIPISLRIFQFVVIRTIKDFSVINEAEVDVFLEFSCFFNDPADISNLIFGSSAFSKSCLYIWKPSVHILLKPGLKDFEHYPSSMWNESIYMIVWTFFVITLL